MFDYSRALKSRRLQTELCTFFIGPARAATSLRCVRCNHTWAEHFGRYYDPRVKPPRGR